MLTGFDAVARAADVAASRSGPAPVDPWAPRDACPELELVDRTTADIASARSVADEAAAEEALS